MLYLNKIENEFGMQIFLITILNNNFNLRINLI